MIKRIIVEGPDCSGKSTAVNLIKNTLKWDSKSLHHKKGDQFERYLKEYAINTEIVFDRAHFSEYVYSELWRNGNPFTDKELEILNFLSLKDSLIVFVLPSLKTMRTRYLSRDYEQEISIHELEKSRLLFQQIMKKVNHLIYTAESYDELNKLIMQIKARLK